MPDTAVSGEGESIFESSAAAEKTKEIEIETENDTKSASESEQLRRENIEEGDIPSETARPAPSQKDSTKNDETSISEGVWASDTSQDVSSNAAIYTCTLSVRCDAILANIDVLNPAKIELVPEDGVIFFSQTVEFYEEESVFNVLMREMKRAKIHMEFNNVPIYDSAYIKGINNLYELDCGELSGWTYKVNGLFPGYGCSQYQLKEGDVVEFVYTCDLGRDVS